MTTKSVTNATLNIVLLSSSTGIKLSLINHNETADTACISLMRTSNGTSHTSNPLLAAHLKMHFLDAHLKRHFPHLKSSPCCTPQNAFPSPWLLSLLHTYVVTSEVQPEFSVAHFSFRAIYEWTCKHFTEYYDNTAEGTDIY